MMKENNCSIDEIEKYTKLSKEEISLLIISHSIIYL